LADARTVLAQRNAVESLAVRAGVTLPPTMRQRFQAGDVAGASGEAEAERNAMLAIVEADGTRVQDDDVLSRIGCWARPGGGPGGRAGVRRRAT
jgi:hypothetical protein